MGELRGVLSAVTTPFTAPDGEVDDAILRELVERTVGAGVHGLVPCGSTGEFAGLTNDERRHVLEVVVDQNARRVPVVAHVGAMTTRETVALARHAEGLGVDAVMAVAPYYEPLTLKETKDYFRSLASAVGVPVVVYNLPVATGLNLEPAEVVSLARENQNIAYVKDTTGDFSQAARLIHDYGADLKTLVGWDTLFLAAVVEGAAGSIVGAANFIARDLVEVYDHVLAGRLPAAKDAWARVFPVMQFLVSGGYVGGVKGALEILGYPAGSPREPIEPLPADRRNELELILKTLTDN